LTPARIRTELRRDRWRRLCHGVLLTRPEAPTRTDWINAGMALGGPSAVLSGWDCARLRGLGSVRPPSPNVLILTTGGRNRVVGGLHFRPSARPLASTEISLLDEQIPGVRIAGNARAICDTALLYRSQPAVRALVTAGVQRGLCTPEQLALELARGPRNGSAQLRAALADVFAGALSIAEAEAVGHLRKFGVTGFRANAAIYDAAGNLLYRADLLWPRLQAIVEIDSREFHFSEQDWKATMRRHNVLTAMGYAVQHYPPSEVRGRGAAWAADVDAWLRARASSLGLHYP
jgi:hypothetical protein